MQHLLSRHPRITIHGQEPPDLTWGLWLQTVINGAQFARESNAEMNYAKPHYAGASDRVTAASGFLRFVREFLSAGRDSARWGVKSFLQCRVVIRPILDVWPDTRWIVCLRDPFRSIESVRNTYDKREVHSLETICRWWTESAQFAQSCPQAMLVQFDRLTTPERRRQMVTKIFQFIDEEPTDAVWRFVDEWPVVHKAVADEERSFRLNEADRHAMLTSNPEFAAQVEELGCLARPQVMHD